MNSYFRGSGDTSMAPIIEFRAPVNQIALAQTIEEVSDLRIEID